MIAPFSPVELDFTAAINSTGPIGDDLDLVDPIPLPVSFPEAVHSDPAPQDTVVTAAVEPSAGPFQIRDLILFDVGFVSIFDPDVGRVVRVKALTFAGSQDGPGSIQITAGQVLLVRVVYHAGPAATTETVQLVITTAEADRATIPLSLTTFVPPPLSMVETALSADHFSIVVGARAQLSVTVRSVSGPATDVRFEKSEIFQDAKVTMESVTVHVEPGQTGTATLLFQADADATLGTFDLAIQQFALTPANHLPFLDIRVTVLAVPPPPDPGVDESIQWAQAGTSALAINKDQGIWHSGHVNAIIPLGGDAILVGADTGGVWSVNADGGAVPLSNDWENPEITCMAIGPDGPNHFYAGSGYNGASTDFKTVGAVYVSEPDTAFFGFIKWHPVPIVDATGNTFNTGRVLCMVVTTANRKLVLGCDNGVFWADIPALGQPHVFEQVPFLPSMNYAGMALGPDDGVVVAPIGDGTPLSGFFFGSWPSGKLLFQRATIIGAFDVTQMRRTSVASCDGQRRFMYAVTAKADSSMLAVLKSEDGGQTWRPLQTKARGSKGQNRPLETVEVTGFQGNYNNCIAVSPFDPAVVLIGWRNGPWISQDGGTTWDAPHLNDDDPHLHEDLHCLIFDPFDTSGRTFYVGNDGGVAVTRDLGASYTNEHNQHLHTLQFEGNGREFFGVFSVSRLVPGLLGGGLQDNGDVYAAIDSASDEFLQLEGGDGHVVVFLDTGHALHCDGVIASKITANRFDGARLVDGTIVPVGVRGPGGTDVSDGLPLALVEPISLPIFRSADSGQLLYAMACVFGSADIYGLFANNDGGNMHWDYIGSVPISAENGQVWALASLHGDNIFVGTQDGRIFSLSPRSEQPFEFGVPLRDTKPGEIWQICVLRDGVAFASYFSQTNEGFLLQSNFFSWDPLGSNDNVARGTDFPTDEGPIYGFDIDRGAQTLTLFAATDTNIFVSRDQGDTWKLATMGLPRCAHCTELRAVTHNNGQRFLYLSTFGRSVWRAPLT